MKDHYGCPRRRWFNKTIKLPTISRAAPVFGDVAHAVLERYLKADDRGMLDGKPVDLYPDKWMYMKNSFAKKGEPEYTDDHITETEAVLIKTLVDKAITEGIIIRVPGRRVERDIKMPIYKHRGRVAILRGFMDVENPDEIVDHKFVKNMNYALSTKPTAKRAIKKDIQMMTYAFVKYYEGFEGHLRLTLNYFVKDYNDPKVIKRSVTVTKDEVLQFYQDKIEPIVRNMMDIDIDYPKGCGLSWNKVKAADISSECDRHFGSLCPFVKVCYEKETIRKYLSRFGQDDNNCILEQELNISSKGNTMTSLLERMKAEQEKMATAAPSSATPEPVAAPAPVETSTAAPAGGGILGILQASNVEIPKTEAEAVAEAGVAATVETPKAPWYIDGCEACSKNPVRGLSTKMSPCIVCDAVCKEQGKPTSAQYKIHSNPDGSMEFTLKEGKTETVQVVQEPSVKEVETPPSSLSDLFSASSTASTFTAKESEPKPKAKPKAKAKAKSEPKSEPIQKDTVRNCRLTILQNCVAVQGVRDIELVDNVLRELNTDIEAATGKNVSLLNHFEYISTLETLIPETAEKLRLKDTTLVVFPYTKGSAYEALVTGLRQYADVIYTAMDI